jgi:DnaJ-class molecular chaperone
MKSKPQSYSGEDTTRLRAYSKARTPTVQVAKLMHRSIGSLQQKSRRLSIPLGHRPCEKKTMTPKIKEHTCPVCNGTGFPKVKQPAQSGRRVYPVRCKTCAGKGKIADAAD